MAKYAKFLHAHNEEFTDCAGVLADLSLCLAHISESMFSNIAAHFTVTMIKNTKKKNHC